MTFADLKFELTLYRARLGTVLTKLDLFHNPRHQCCGPSAETCQCPDHGCTHHSWNHYSSQILEPSIWNDLNPQLAQDFLRKIQKAGHDSLGQLIGTRL